MRIASTLANSLRLKSSRRALSALSVPGTVQPLVANLFDPAALDGVVTGVDGAVHAASSNDARSAMLDRIVVNALLDAFEGTGKALVSACSRSGPVRSPSSP